MLIPTLLLTACRGSPPPATSPAPVAVRTVTVKRQPIARIVTAGGDLYPLRQADLSPKISAPVRTFYVQRGDRVHRGQLLAVLENRDLVAAEHAAKAALDKAQANYAVTTGTSLPEQVQAAELALQDSQARLKAQEKLYASNLWLYQQHALARKQLDQSEVALTTARSACLGAKQRVDNLKATGKNAMVEAANSQLEAARQNYLSAKAQLQYSEIRSPIAGVVSNRSVYPGQMAAAGAPLITVMDVSRVIARLHVPQPQVALLKVGDPAIVQAPGLKEGVPARVTVISPALDPNSTTVEIWVETANPNEKLQPGTSVSGSITARVIPNALVVPDSAILTGPNGTKAVMVVKPDRRAYRRDVVTGIRQNGETQILSGLEEGEDIVSSGAYGLPNGAKVNPQPAQAQSGMRSHA